MSQTNSTLQRYLETLTQGEQNPCSSILQNLSIEISPPELYLLDKLTSSFTVALEKLKQYELPTNAKHQNTCFASTLDKLFGTDWEGHPFRSKPLFWHRNPLEPDATRMIGKICSYDYCGDKKDQRIRSFCKALQKSISPPPALFDVITAIENAPLEIRCEYPVGKKRIDIVIHEQGKLEHPFIVIEAKFAAPLDNDLKVYEEYAKNPSTNCLCIILGCKDERTEDAKRTWHFAHWAEVLRQWELQLKTLNDIDEDFSRLRASLWAKLVR